MSNKTTFDAVMVDDLIDSYGLIRMLCYPLTKQNGKDSVTVRFSVTIDGQLVDLCEQEQLSVTDITCLDLDLCKYYFLVQNFEVRDFEEVRENYPQARIVEVELEYILG